MTQSQSVAPEAARPTRWTRVPSWLPVVFVLSGLVGLGYYGHNLWQVYRHSAERAATLKLAKLKGYGTARDELLLALERDPRDVEVIREIAVGCYLNLFWPDAAKYLTRWCELDPSSAEAHLFRLRFWRELG